MCGPVARLPGQELSTTSHVYVGDANGVMHQIDLQTGVHMKQIAVASVALGAPSIDTLMSPRRLVFNSLDGRLCTMQLPF